MEKVVDKPKPVYSATNISLGWLEGAFVLAADFEGGVVVLNLTDLELRKSLSEAIVAAPALLLSGVGGEETASAPADEAVAD
ncbi:MAG: hypothetical protein M0Z85_01380 [Gammaproteobacteria bacterium]|nr:hypothetical protein [Gammaproteobacteria bacterium]